MKDKSLNQVNVIQPLVITPSPRAGESVLGFILRASELNGYSSPIRLMHYAGMNDNEVRSVRPPLNKLACLFNRTEDEFKSSGLDTISQSRGRYVEILGHRIPSMFTSCKQASLCSECVEENGYIDGYHEIKYAIACPKHRVRTIRYCPECQNSLSWHRPGLTQCKCGADLAQVIPKKIDNLEVLALLGVLYAKLMKQPLDQQQLRLVGFPSDAMEHISLQTLLSVIYRFGLFNGKQVDSEDVDMAAVETTAKVLSNWPHQFHTYLQHTQVPNIHREASGLRGQFHQFYESLFKNIRASHEVRFIRDAFIAFGAQHWQQAILHWNLKSIDTQTMHSEYLSITDLSRRIGVQPVTLRKLIAQGHLNVEQRFGNATHQLLKLSPQQPFEFAAGLKLSLKQVAQRLDVPVDVLKAYRTIGLFKPKYLVVPFKYFHEKDVQILYDNLMKGMTLKTDGNFEDGISLAQVMRMKQSAENKAHFLKAVEVRDIQPIASISELPSGLIFDRDEVLDVFEKANKQQGNTMGLHKLKQRSALGSRLFYRWVASEKLPIHISEVDGVRLAKNVAEAELASLNADRAYLIHQLLNPNNTDWKQLDLNFKQVIKPSKPNIPKSNSEYTIGYFRMVA